MQGAVGELQGRALWEEARGCPALDIAGSTMDPLQDTAKQSWWHLCENIYERVKCHTGREEKRKRKVQNGSENIKDRGEGGVPSGTAADISLQPVERTTPEQGKRGRGKEWQRENTMYWPIPPSWSLVWSWAWETGEGEVVFIILVFVYWPSLL